MKPYRLEKSISFQSLLTYKAFVGAMEARLVHSGVSAVQFTALAILTAEPPMRQAELAAKLSIAPPSAVKLIDRMERDGWVKRQEDPADRRVKLVSATEQARDAWAELSTHAREVLDTACRGIDEEELETAMKVLRKVRKNLEP